MKIKEFYSADSIDSPLTIKEVKPGDIFKCIGDYEGYFFMSQNKEIYDLFNGIQTRISETTPVAIYDGTVILDKEEWMINKNYLL